MKQLIRYISTALAGAIFLIAACTSDEVSMQSAVYDDTPYELKYGHLPAPPIPVDNLLTVEGVQLGKMLFYEPMLSKDGSQSCASCHRQADGFSDPNRFSLGVEGLKGERHAMSVFNMAWNTNGFFWDGRSQLLRHQSLLPIQDPLEMNEMLENVKSKLGASDAYRDQFVRAFGTSDITSEKISLALEQFMFSIVSFESKYDRYLAGEATLSESEERGMILYETEYNQFFPDESGADCAHCHGGLNFENDEYMNNGLDLPSDMTDIGREAVTGDPRDRARFKVPSLRNIAVTAPYMHDGRFATLEEVIDHYDHGIQVSPSLDPALLNTTETGLMLSEQDKEDLINFMKTLTDETFLNNPAYQSPF